MIALEAGSVPGVVIFSPCRAHSRGATGVGVDAVGNRARRRRRVRPRQRGPVGHRRALRHRDARTGLTATRKTRRRGGRGRACDGLDLGSAHAHRRSVSGVPGVRRLPVVLAGGAERDRARGGQRAGRRDALRRAGAYSGGAAGVGVHAVGDRSRRRRRVRPDSVAVSLTAVFSGTEMLAPDSPPPERLVEVAVSTSLGVYA